MTKQNYNNHKRYYTLHHFVFLPLMILLIVFGMVSAYKDEIHRLEWWMFSTLSICILFLAVLLRQHYALGNQDRIVRLEFRLRYFELFGKNANGAEAKLSFSQVAALRFTNDKEFVELLNKALKENISGDEIKKSIKDWQADEMRV